MTGHYVTEAVVLALSDDWQSSAEIRGKVLASATAVNQTLNRLVASGRAERRDSITIRHQWEYRLVLEAAE